MKKETWKKYKDTYYEFSNLGRARTVDHYIFKNFKYKQVKVFKKGQLIKIIDRADGYKEVSIFSKKYLIHRIVAELFIPNPLNLPQVNHKDENRGNNNADNLEWCSSKYNNNYGKHNKKVSKTKSKKVYQINEDNIIIGIYENAKEANAITGICQSGITHACNGRNFIAGGFYWSYDQGGRAIDLTKIVTKRSRKKKYLNLTRECMCCKKVSVIHARNLCGKCYQRLQKINKLNNYPKEWTK